MFLVQSSPRNGVPTQHTGALLAQAGICSAMLHVSPSFDADGRRIACDHFGSCQLPSMHASVRSNGRGALLMLAVVVVAWALGSYWFRTNVITFYHYPIYFCQSMMRPYRRHSLDTFCPGISVIRSRNSARIDMIVFDYSRSDETFFLRAGVYKPG